MKKRLLSLLLAFTLVCSLCLTAAPAAKAAGEEQDPNFYYFTDREGNEMMAPKNAFAVRVAEFTPGDPWTKVEYNMDPQIALGLPDYTEISGGYSTGDLNLGKKGVLVLEFDVAIYDGEGLDIYVFEVGPDVESTVVEVSQDLVTWYEVGTTKGKTAGVDLAGKVPEGARFRYVRLTDTGTNGNSSRWPGADIDAVSGLNTKAVTSNWAEDEVDRADEYDLIPEVLDGKDMTQPITRLEFAAVCVKVFENLTGTKALPAVENPFTDTEDAEVLKAYNAGITNGTSDTTFEPDKLLDREMCATMLTRVFKRCTMPGWTLSADGEYTLDYEMPEAFADDAAISPWARDSVYFMAANGIINGMGDNTFAPRNTTPAQEAQGYANATREQALAIAVRMVENLK